LIIVLLHRLVGAAGRRGRTHARRILALNDDLGFAGFQVDKINFQPLSIVTAA
jgi:hypothetical protein